MQKPESSPAEDTPAAPEFNAKERLAALREALEDAKRSSGRDSFLILTHRSPDPDAMGAAIGMRALLEGAFQMKATVATVGRIHRAENLAMVRELGLEFADSEAIDHSAFAGLVLVDTQPSFGHTVIPGNLPVTAIIDHHEPPTPKPDDEPLEPSEPQAYSDVRVGVGATSSMVYEYLREAGVKPDARTAGALFCGVRYDTGDLAEGVTDLDQRAWYQCFRRADQSALQRIQRPPLPAEYFSQLAVSLRNARQHGDMVLGLLGEVVNPESVAEMADFFVRLEGARWALVGGAYQGEYYLSLRTAVAERGAYDLLEAVLDGRGSFGGHGRIAGGRVQFDEYTESALRELETSLRERVLMIARKGTSGDGPDSEFHLGRPLA